MTSTLIARFRKRRRADVWVTWDVMAFEDSKTLGWTAA